MFYELDLMLDTNNIWQIEWKVQSNMPNTIKAETFAILCISNVRKIRQILKMSCDQQYAILIVASSHNSAGTNIFDFLPYKLVKMFFLRVQAFKSSFA